MLTLGRKTAQRWPLLAPAAAVVLLVAWNLGFVSHFRARKYPGAAPIERLATDQARAWRRTMQDVMGAVAGAEGRSLAYKYFSAEYFYTDFNKSGTILLRSADESYLLEGWHTPSRRIARRTFRRALYPQALRPHPPRRALPPPRDDLGPGARRRRLSNGDIRRQRRSASSSRMHFRTKAMGNGLRPS